MRAAKYKTRKLIAAIAISLRGDERIAKKAGLKRIAAPAAFALCFIAGTDIASAAIVEINENLNNNIVPSGFTLSATPGTAGLVGGRLQATRTNGSAALVYDSLPGGLNQIDISYRGQFVYSQWGTYTRISLGGLPISFTHGVNDPPVQWAQWGANNYASISDQEISTNPFNYPVFEYDILVTEGQVNYRATDTLSNVLAFNLTLADANIVLANINQISFRTHNTTGNGPVWLDDINIKLSTVPVPAAVWLFGTALIGLIGFGKRRRAA